MKLPSLFFVIAFIACDVVLSVWLLVHGKTIAIFQPRGMIAMQERSLILTAVGLMLLVVIPVFILTAYIAWKYRSSNTNASYVPDRVSSTRFEIGLWCIPLIIVSILAVITWKMTHKLDPYKAIAAGMPPITIQVIAIRWRWVFLYPVQNIATVNTITIPVHTPVHFELTADAPMNSFWIPQLGGQMYAMPGMETQHNLIADTIGTYTGSAAELSGQGFADMRFSVQSVPQSDFASWVQSVKAQSKTLDMAEYARISQPSEDDRKMYYSSVEKDLYNNVMAKFLAPSPTGGSQTMSGMQ